MAAVMRLGVDEVGVTELMGVTEHSRAMATAARRLNSGALEAESRQTMICAYLSAILLAGLGLNAWLGWWWADPARALP